MVQMAMEEDVDAIGLSFLGCEHLFYAKKLIEELEKRELGHLKIIMGGVIPPDDVATLKTLGVDLVFTPGTSRDQILSSTRELLG